MGTIITLTTDFGLADAYAGVLKGVILRINPEVQIVDICHSIKPQNVREAAFVLSTAYQYFPTGTIHVVVVDPGVGTNRLPVILKTPAMYFVAPDNGVLSYILDSFSSQAVPSSERVTLGPDLKAYALISRDYWLKPVSNTFHGRDIFAPIAARLSLGMPASSLGQKIDTLSAFSIPHPEEKDGVIRGQVLHVDSFGNLITNIRSERLSGKGQSVTIVVGEHRVRGLVRTYAEGEGLMALAGSSGYLEVSLKNRDAANFLRAQAGDEIKVEFAG